VLDKKIADEVEAKRISDLQDAEFDKQA